MKVEKIEFVNSAGYRLSGRLELPVNTRPHNYAVFAHCFTCSKNFHTSRNITRALTSAGYGVLRFDFTGLGDSEGDFADTNFSGNVEDLIAAIDHLGREYKAPTLLIGHSLGGAAAIYASAKAKSIKAVATIGTPSDTKHVKHLFGDQLDTIKKEGESVVQLSGRPFKIKSQFLSDLNEQMVTDTLRKSEKPILIAHSPQDSTVGIHHAEKLYLAAMHPKSFVSLDGADHLLTDKEDSRYIGKVIAQWASRYLEIPETKQIKTNHQVAAELDDKELFTTQIKAGSHYFVADEPLDVGGNDFGPTPYDLLSSGLAACTVMTIQMYARRKKWTVENVQCDVSYGKVHQQDCESCEDSNAKIDTFTREISFQGNLTQEQTDKLMKIADKCPVHRTLYSPTQVITKLKS